MGRMEEEKEVIPEAVLTAPMPTGLHCPWGKSRILMENQRSAAPCSPGGSGCPLQTRKATRAPPTSTVRAGEARDGNTHNPKRGGDEG